MDNLTHTLTGVALSHAGFNRKTRFATLALVVGANLPDVDAISLANGSVSYLEHHRGVTHSLVGVTALALILAAAIYYPGRRARPKPSAPPLRGRWLLLACFVATASHLLLDFTNAYGVRPLLPFSGRWYAWDIMPIIDPLLLFLLVVALGLPVIFRLVSEEVGARRSGYRAGAWCALGAMLLLWGFRDLSHRRVVNLLGSHNYGGEAPLALGAFPTANPFVWKGVVETDSAFHVIEAGALDSDVDPTDAVVFRKPESSPALLAALETHVGRVYLDFARFPWAEVLRDEDGYRVQIRDLRFGSLSSTIPSFVATIELDSNLRARSENFAFHGTPPG
jgi:inner membrane protein